MEHVWVGVIAIIIGLLLCFRGFVALRALITVWGAFVGFALGATLAASFTGGSTLHTWLAWLVAVAVGVVVAALAYSFYAVGVIVTAGSGGYALLAWIGTSLGLHSALVTILGVIGAVVLAIIALVTNLPRLLLSVASALAGAGTATVGAMLVARAVTFDDLAPQATTLHVAWWWELAYLVLFIFGLVAQLKVGTHEDLRRAYAHSPSGR